jgi:hypothetical protein
MSNDNTELVNNYWIGHTQQELRDIEQLKNSVEPEKILWSTTMATDESLCRALYYRMYQLSKDIHLPEHRRISTTDINFAREWKPPLEFKDELASPMAIYTAWDAIVQALPRYEDYAGLIDKIERRKTRASDYSWMLMNLSIVRNDLSIIVNMLKGAFD